MENKEREIFSKHKSKFFPQRQKSFINSIEDEINEEYPVVGIAGYAHVKITPRGYKPPNLSEMISAVSLEKAYEVKKFISQLPKLDKLEETPLANTEEPQWKKEFFQKFAGKKIVLLIDKPFIHILAQMDAILDRVDLFKIQ